MKSTTRKSERGIALLVVLFAMILVSVIGLALMFSTNGETSVNSGYRQSNLAYFAARSGVEELRDRIRTTSAAGPNGLQDFLPTVPIGHVAAAAPTAGVVYIMNLDATETGLGYQPWNPKAANGIDDNPYFDDELCHETVDPLSTIVHQPWSSSKPCPRDAGSLPTAPGWRDSAHTGQPLPLGATISYKWARINLKMNESSSPWCVLGFNSVPGAGNCARQVGIHAATDQVCYNGKNEFVITKADEPIDVPGRVSGVDLPSQLALAMGMYAGGSAGHGNAGHASSSTSASSSTAGSATAGSSSTGSSTSGSSTSGSSTTGTSSSSSSTGLIGTASSSSTGGSSSTSSTSGSSSSSSVSSSSSSSGSTGLIGTTSTSSSGSTGLIGTGSTSTSSSTGLIGTTSTSSTSSSTGKVSSSSSSGSSSSSTSSSTGTSTGGSPPAVGCTKGTAPLPGTPVGIGAAPVSATSCAQVEAQPVYLLTSLAVAPNSSANVKARRMIQYEVAKVALPPLPSALTLAGPNPNVTVPHSASYGIHGNDEASCGAAQNRPAVGTVGDGMLSPAGTNAQAEDSRGNVIDALSTGGVKPTNYDGVDGCKPDVQNVQNIVNPLLTTPNGLNDIVHNVMNAAQVTYPSDETFAGGAMGTDANPLVTVVNGDLTLTGDTTGSGILLVTGALTFKGNFSFNGIILVIGKGVINQSGGGSGDFHGAVVVANIASTDPKADYAHNPTENNLASTLGSPQWLFNGGGGNGLQYNSCNINLGMQSASYTVIARREITY